MLPFIVYSLTILTKQQEIVLDSSWKSICWGIPNALNSRSHTFRAQRVGLQGPTQSRPDETQLHQQLHPRTSITPPVSTQSHPQLKTTDLHTAKDPLQMKLSKSRLHHEISYLKGMRASSGLSARRWEELRALLPAQRSGESSHQLRINSGEGRETLMSRYHQQGLCTQHNMPAQREYCRSLNTF